LTYSNPKIVILGANGQLGSDLLAILEDHAPSLVPMYRRNIDVENTEDISRKLPELGPSDYLINCTSYHKTDECEDNADKSFKINTLAVMEMAKYCSLHGATMIHVSTDYVFDGNIARPYNENDAAHPLNVYGCSKLAGEILMSDYCKKHFIFRTASLFGVAGSSGKGGNFVETMISLYKQGKDIKVVNDMIMSPTHTLDVARAIKEFVTKGHECYGIFNCVNTGAVSWYAFAKAIFDLLNMKDVKLTSILTSDFKTKARRPIYSALDNAKISNYFTFQNWRDALKEYLERKLYL